MAESTHRHHALDYIEIPVVDVAAAKQFYGSAFGWAFNDYGPTMPYSRIPPDQVPRSKDLRKRTRDARAARSFCSSRTI